MSPKHPPTTREKLITIGELSEWLGVPVTTLRYWRHYGEGPPAIKVGAAVRYRPSDVEAWLAERSEAQP